MKKPKVVREKNIDETDLAILNNTTISPDVASIMVNFSAKQVHNYRHQSSRREALRKASVKYRKKLKQDNLRKFGKNNGCYKYWTPEEIKYIMTSKDSDVVMAKTLNRTVYSIQKKRERELKKNG